MLENKQWELKKSNIHYLTDQVDVKKNQINFEKKNLLHIIMIVTQSFQKLISKHLKNEIRQNQGICHNGAFVV